MIEPVAVGGLTAARRVTLVSGVSSSAFFVRDFLTFGPAKGSIVRETLVAALAGVDCAGIGPDGPGSDGPGSDGAGSDGAG